MKKQAKIYISFILILSFALSPIYALADYTGNAHYINTVNVADGLTYENIIKKIAK